MVEHTDTPGDGLAVAWQATTEDGQPIWDESSFSDVPHNFDYERPLYAAEQARVIEGLLSALRKIVAITDESAGEFRKRGGTYRGLIGIVAAEAIAKAEGRPFENYWQSSLQVNAEGKQ
jgi:hypothetical protein